VEIDTSMRALPVVVPFVLPKDSLEMAMTKDENPIEAFSPNSPHPTLSEVQVPLSTSMAPFRTGARSPGRSHGGTDESGPPPIPWRPYLSRSDTSCWALRAR